MMRICYAPGPQLTAVQWLSWPHGACPQVEKIDFKEITPKLTFGMSPNPLDKGLLLASLTLFPVPCS